jgi:SAM-dependent methyltransferase
VNEDRQYAYADFGRVAGYYAGRTPYLPRYFATVAETLALSTKSFVLDLACGTGELAMGLAPYCGSVLAMDPSAEMISHRRATPANVRFVVASPGVDPILPAKRADLVVIGRAIQYFGRGEILPFLEAVTETTASVMICGANIDPATPWCAAYRHLRNRYSRFSGSPDRSGTELFADSIWSQGRAIVVKAQAQYTLQDMMDHALSHSSALDAILADRDRFRRDLDALLAPYRTAEGRIRATIVNWGLEYTRR